MRKILLKRVLQKISLTLVWLAVIHRGEVLANAPNYLHNGDEILTSHQQANQSPVTGTVTDIAGKPLIDVNVQVKSKNISTQTDLDGKFSINANAGDVLIFSVVSYQKKEVAVELGKTIQVTLQEAVTDLPKVFNSLYVPQKRTTNTAAIGEVRSEELTKTVSTYINGTIAGRLAGLQAFQGSGEPGADNYTVTLRGQAPLFMLDGVPQSFSSINPEQIESVTVLKDAVSTAMLGMRSSGGVIQLTTKKGAEGAQRISFTALSGLQSPLNLPNFLNAYDYSRLYNEALANDGKAPAYTQADLDAYRNHTDPIGHPDVDWQKEILKSKSPYNRFDLAISGGRKVARYFVDLDYLNQQGLIKTADFNTYNTGVGYKRYIFRSNVDVDLSKDVSTYLNVFTRIQNQDQPGNSASNIFSSFRATPNNAYPVLNDNGTLGGNRDYTNNIYGQTVYSGYQPQYFRDFRVDLGLKAKLDKILPGLWVAGRGSINAYLAETITRTKAFATYQQNANAQGAAGYQQFSNPSTMSNAIEITAQNTRFYTELSSGWSKKIGDHELQALLLGNIDNVTENSQLPSYVQGISGKLSYNYQEKYLLDVALAYNGSLAYPKNNRYGFFPAIGLGWNIKQEDFLKNTASWLNILKLRASYGKTGNNNAGYFEYNKYYASGTGYNFGEAVTPVSGVQEGALNNPNLTWEKALKFNGGVDASMFENKLSISADYFIDSYYDLLQSIGTNAQVLGNAYPRVNIGKQRYSGLELQLTYSNKIGKFGYFISPNISTLKSKVTYQDEVQRKYSWMQRTGMPVNQAFGYQADGLYQSAQEIASSAVPVGITPQPGDIKFRDLNQDGTIDENDITAIGGTKPLLYGGLNLGANWKGFDFSALVQGVANRMVYLSGNSYWEFQGSGKEQAYEHHLNRWTPATAATATYPRLSIGRNLNNQQFSSYWYKPANYLRLRSIELGYTLPVSIIKKIRLTRARIFVNGYNLFTTTQLNGLDPESYTGGYPVQKLITAGVNINL
ncbi:TonB-dependent receptor [Mucilaginibacter sp. PAMB04168]|uniref:SusC/RagA family TonB-linked outer membrane protein n=1 Tax=Mucilaginibacter sp. PAMB04168 TaxID=3138567 RepID=UPI0031F6D7D4